MKVDNVEIVLQVNGKVKGRLVVPAEAGREELEKLVKDLNKQMKKAAADLDFETAAELRDKLVDLKKMLNDLE